MLLFRFIACILLSLRLVILCRSWEIQREKPFICDHIVNKVHCPHNKLLGYIHPNVGYNLM